ncbi:MAG TPA: hypothetical protein VN903_24885, partial [Polyangia bacterium]|nr:hypothetical protein [Polyangia bacterium]
MLSDTNESIGGSLFDLLTEMIGGGHLTRDPRRHVRRAHIAQLRSRAGVKKWPRIFLRPGQGATRRV